MIGFVLRVTLAFVATILAGYYILGQVNEVVWIASAMSGFVIAKLTMANLMPMGHGVNGSRHIMGMPIFIFVWYLLLLCIILFLMLTNVPELLPVTNANFRVFGLGLFFGWAGSIVDWYVSSSKLTYYASEFQERLSLKARGCDDKYIDTLIEQMRSKGVFPPKAKRSK